MRLFANHRMTHGKAEDGESGMFLGLPET